MGEEWLNFEMQSAGSALILNDGLKVHRTRMARFQNDNFNGRVSERPRVDAGEVVTRGESGGPSLTLFEGALFPANPKKR
jgi:hypothetical protein